MQERPRARRGNTHDRWPCCGEPPGTDFGRPKEGICLECRELIEAGKEAIARQQKAGASTYGWPERAHWWPRYYGDYLFDDHETGKRLSDAMYEVVQAVTERSLRTEYRPYGDMFLDCQETHVGYQGVSSRVTANPTVRGQAQRAGQTDPRSAHKHLQRGQGPGSERDPGIGQRADVPAGLREAPERQERSVTQGRCPQRTPATFRRASNPDCPQPVHQSLRAVHDEDFHRQTHAPPRRPGDRTAPGHDRG